jgi:hypothetical protein
MFANSSTSSSSSSADAARDSSAPLLRGHAYYHYWGLILLQLALIVFAIYALSAQHTDEILQTCGYSPWTLLLARLICDLLFHLVVHCSLSACSSIGYLKTPLVMGGTPLLACVLLALFLGLEGVLGAQALWSSACVDALTAGSAHAALLPIALFLYFAHDLLSLLGLLGRALCGTTPSSSSSTEEEKDSLAAGVLYGLIETPNGHPPPSPAYGIQYYYSDDGDKPQRGDDASAMAISAHFWQ